MDHEQEVELISRLDENCKPNQGRCYGNTWRKRVLAEKLIKVTAETTMTIARVS